MFRLFYSNDNRQQTKTVIRHDLGPGTRKTRIDNCYKLHITLDQLNVLVMISHGLLDVQDVVVEVGEAHGVEIEEADDENSVEDNSLEKSVVFFHFIIVHTDHLEDTHHQDNKDQVEELEDDIGQNEVRAGLLHSPDHE